MCFCCVLLYFYFISESTKSGNSVCSREQTAVDGRKGLVRPVDASDGCQMKPRLAVNVGNDPNLTHEVYQYMVDAHFCFIVFVSCSEDLKHKCGHIGIFNIFIKTRLIKVLIVQFSVETLKLLGENIKNFSVNSSYLRLSLMLGAIGSVLSNTAYNEPKVT